MRSLLIVTLQLHSVFGGEKWAQSPEQHSAEQVEIVGYRSGAVQLCQQKCYDLETARLCDS